MSANTSAMTATLQPPWNAAQAAAIDAQLERLLAGEALRRSARLQRLLRHVVDATLAGNAQRLKGYILGVEVFDRGTDFDPNIDPIVRIEAGRLRGKLLEHYCGEGAGDPLLVEMPKGGYAVRFVPRSWGSFVPTVYAAAGMPWLMSTVSRP